MAEKEKIVSRIYEKFGSLDGFQREMIKNGIQEDDPRMKNIMRILRNQHQEDDDKSVTITKRFEIYTKLLDKFSKQEFILPNFKGFTDTVTEIYKHCKGNMNGANAAYIPQLSVAKDFWGVSVCTVDGQVFSVGDTKVPFTIQSCSKPLSYAIALECLTSDVVHQYVGQEPSGRMFNEMVLDHNKKPHNPMINSGAIVVASLLHALVDGFMSTAEKFDFVKSWVERAAGGTYFGFNNSVFLSEREVADRNFAMCYYMRENKVFPKEAKMLECLDFYFQLCSMESTAEALSVIAGTLANGGVCPTTGDRVFSPETVRDVLSLMHSCGLYDYSGQFAFKVGLPAKSGVAGALMLIIPNLVGICCFSPKLDTFGNSVRSVQFCEELLRKYSIHPYDNLRFSTKNFIQEKNKNDSA